MGVLELVHRFRLGRNGGKDHASSSLVAHIIQCATYIRPFNLCFRILEHTC